MNGKSQTNTSLPIDLRVPEKGNGARQFPLVFLFVLIGATALPVSFFTTNDTGKLTLMFLVFFSPAIVFAFITLQSCWELCFPTKDTDWKTRNDPLGLRESRISSSGGNEG